jgi:hypothetical protein
MVEGFTKHERERHDEWMEKHRVCYVQKSCTTEMQDIHTREYKTFKVVNGVFVETHKPSTNEELILCGLRVLIKDKGLDGFVYDAICERSSKAWELMV